MHDTPQRELFEIISGYGSPATNRAWRKRSHGGVARDNLHMQGMAVDIRLPGRELDEDLPVGSEHDFVRLQVSVHHPLFVGVAHGLAGVQEHADQTSGFPALIRGKPQHLSQGASPDLVH
jgi:Bacterial protein of unknown function (DUF882)